jgi:hypothetical protein
VFGGSRSGRECGCEGRNWSGAEIEHPEGGPARGERSESNLSGQDAGRCPAGVRAAIVARKRGNARGAKGGRKANEPRP